MKTVRKLQLGAVAVILNGLAAFTAMTPQAALANPCPVRGFCGLCPTLAYCQSIASPGCTATSTSCVAIPCAGTLVLGACHYD
jgi:hypothetical protein